MAQIDIDRRYPWSIGITDGMEFEGAADTEALRETVRQLRAVLKPVEPSPDFRKTLLHRLTSSARRQHSHLEVASSPERGSGIWWGAAILSVFGALMYVRRSRGQQGGPQSVTTDNSTSVQKVPSSAWTA